jgi:hypothetical protein
MMPAHVIPAGAGGKPFRSPSRTLGGCYRVRLVLEDRTFSPIISARDEDEAEMKARSLAFEMPRTRDRIKAIFVRRICAPDYHSERDAASHIVRDPRGRFREAA